MKEITDAITTRQAQIRNLQADIDALQRAASALGGKKTVKATNQPEAKPKTKREQRGMSAAAQGSPRQPKTTQKRKQSWSAADRAAISKRMKRYWANRRKVRR